MAARDHKPSRRALLGAAVAIPFVGCGGGDTPPPRFARSPSPSKLGEELSWREALAGFREAEEALRGFLERTAGAPDEEQEAVEGEMDERLDALGPALLRLLAAPAPDLEGLVVKIETIVAMSPGRPPAARIAWRIFAGTRGGWRGLSKLETSRAAVTSKRFVRRRPDARPAVLRDSGRSLRSLRYGRVAPDWTKLKE